MSRFLNSDDLIRILGSIADKITEPVIHAYICEEDERLAKAVISALSRDLIDETTLKKWFARFTSPPNGIVWSEAFSNEAETNARHNTITFLRSLYFQLRLVQQNDISNQTMRDELLAGITDSLKSIDDWVYVNED